MLRLVMFMFTALLQSMLSPLEIGACIAVVDVSVVMPEITREVVRLTRSLQCAIALASLFLAVCDWHVPRITPYRNFVCRFLSAMCMQALFPYSPTLTCLAFLYPTFGKKAQSPPTSAPESGASASEHISTSARDQICLDDIIAKLKTAGNEDTRAAEILAAAITLRDSSGRDRKVALRHMANAWGGTVNEQEEC